MACSLDSAGDRLAKQWDCLGMVCLEVESPRGVKRSALERGMLRFLLYCWTIAFVSMFPLISLFPCLLKAKAAETMPEAGGSEQIEPPASRELLPSEFETDTLSQAELETFARAFAQMVELRKTAKVELAAAISDEDLTPERYLKIRDNRQGIDTSELVHYLRAEENVNLVREQLEQDMQQVVEGEGMAVERFHEIFLEIQAKPPLQDRLQQIWQRL